MEILLINTALRPNSKVKMFPVGISYIATAMKNAGHQFDILDHEAWRPLPEEGIAYLKRKKYDVVALASLASGYKMVKALCQLIRDLQPQATIIVGNTVASSIPEILLKNTEADIAVLGEGDITIVELLKGIEIHNLYGISGIVFKYYASQSDKIAKKCSIMHNDYRYPIKDLDTLPWINFDLFDTELYIDNTREQISRPFPTGLTEENIRMLPINTARGCAYNCSFCYHAFKGMPYRTRSPQSVMDEADHLVKKYGINYIGFSDELTFYTRKQTDNFISTMENKWPDGTPFFWMANMRANLFSSEDDLLLIQRMKSAGCHGFFFSLESADPHILNAMNKKITVDQFIKQARLVQKVNLPVWTSIVLGYEEETPETIKETFRVCADLGTYPSIGYLLLQPGTPVYERAKINGYIKDEEEYLLSMGDRQTLLLNITEMPDDEFIQCVT